jgi:membrane-bound serine protease (ClpP class)
MNILADPNIAYLFLVTGVFLAFLALFSPGTGLLELGALFSLLIAGYGIYNLPVNPWALALLVVGVFPFLLALRRTRRWIYLVVSLLALVIGSAYLFRSDLWYQPAVHPLLAPVVSVLMIAMIWIIARKSLEAIEMRKVNSLSDVVGATGQAVTDIHEEGSVYLQGELWSARSLKPIAANHPVRVVKRRGFTLEVEEIPPAGSSPSS